MLARVRGAPLVDADRLIVIVGGQPDAKVMALDKRTGKEIRRALSSDTEPGYAQPVIAEAGGLRQLIVWHPTAVASLDPVTGRVHWQEPFRINKLSPQGYHEVSRTSLIKPTSNPGNRRELGAVNWTHPPTRTGTSSRETTMRSSACRSWNRDRSRPRNA